MPRLLQDSATCAKAAFDKFVVDKAEEKAAFDKVLEDTMAEASSQKATADKALVDVGEMQVGGMLLVEEGPDTAYNITLATHTAVYSVRVCLRDSGWLYWPV
jgi:hypothetical protein